MTPFMCMNKEVHHYSQSPLHVTDSPQNLQVSKCSECVLLIHLFNKNKKTMKYVNKTHIHKKNKNKTKNKATKKKN